MYAVIILLESNKSGAEFDTSPECLDVFAQDFFVLELAKCSTFGLQKYDNRLKQQSKVR